MWILSKNIQNYYYQELIRFIFQKLDNLSRVKWYISINLLKLIKPVDCHYLERHIKVTLITKSTSKSFPCSLAPTILRSHKIVLQLDFIISNTQGKQKLVRCSRGSIYANVFLRQIKSREVKNRLI